MHHLVDAKIESMLNRAVQIGRLRLASPNAPKYSDPTICESFLVDLLKRAAQDTGINPQTIIHHGGHTFPDVSIASTGVGIELKGTTSSRRFNGNSVVGSTMLENLHKIYLFYWIGSTGELGVRDYFECVLTPVVTHSPRFQLDIDIEPNQSMFGTTDGKVGSTDKIIFGPGGIDSDLIIKWMANNAKSRGETPWWIPTDESLPVGSTGLVKTTGLNPLQRRAFMKCAFLAFPIILDKKSPTKYNGFQEWAITAKSVLPNRDLFSAGGKVSFKLANFSTHSLEVPQVLKVAIDSLSARDTVFLAELEEPHGRRFSSGPHFLKYYSEILPKFLTHLFDDVQVYDTNKIGKKGFATILAREIVSRVDPDSLVQG